MKWLLAIDFSYFYLLWCVGVGTIFSIFVAVTGFYWVVYGLGSLIASWL